MIDTSAIIAIIQGEAEEPALSAAIKSAPQIHIPSPVVFETLMVLKARGGDVAVEAFRTFLSEVSPTFTVFTETTAEMAFDAFLKYGKGRHPAALNFGDCMVYAAAKVSSQPLLYVGNDFSQTDIPSALAS